MGCGLSCHTSRAVTLSEDVVEKTDSNRNQFRLTPVILTKEEAQTILEDKGSEAGTYILYEELKRGQTYLAFKTIESTVAQYPIVQINDLYYFNDFPFPYLESVVLYYKKYKMNGTRLTNQAVLDRYVMVQRSSRRNRSSKRKSHKRKKHDPYNSEVYEQSKAIPTHF